MAFYETNHSSPAFSKRSIFDNKNINFPQHLHASFELLFVKEGELEVEIDRELYYPKAGDAVLILPNAVHSYRTPEHSLVSIMIFSPDYLSELYEQSKIGIRHFPIIHDARIIADKIRENENDYYMLRACLYRLAVEYEKNEESRVPLARESGFVTVFSEYMETHCTEPITETDAAKALGYHPRYLSSLIRKSFDASFCRLLNEYRVHIACEYLRSEKMSITDIWIAVGYESQCSFNRNFKAIMGVTPIKYRQGYRMGQTDHRQQIGERI